MTNHAVLSASASHRWLNCPPSVRLTERIPDNGSIYAAEGSEAHELCEFKLRQLLGMEAHNPLDTPIGLQYYDGTMEDATTGYAAFVLELLTFPKPRKSPRATTRKRRRSAIRKCVLPRRRNSIMAATCRT